MRSPASAFSLLFLFATFAVGNALAAPVEYGFLAVVGTRDQDVTDQKLPPQLTPRTQFIGTLTLDPARTVNGSIAPVVALRLRLIDGTEVFNSQSHPLSSTLTTSSAGGLESVLIAANVDLVETNTRVRIQLSWASPGQGQLPADPRTLDILALQPYAWKLALVGTALSCETGCVSFDEKLDAHIWNVQRAAASAEYEESFTAAPSSWTNTGGDWTTQSGYYTNAANVSFTSSVYNGENLQPFAEVRADLYSGFVNSGNALGLLFNYRDANNFYEARFTATGVVTINRIANGVRTMLQTGSYSVPPKTFFHVSVLLDFGAIEVRVNNAPAIIAEGTGEAQGRAGVFASWNRARFDNFAIDELLSWTRTVSESFSSAETRFEARSGTWVIENGVYRNTSNESAAISTLPPPASVSEAFTDDFAAYTRMKLQWSAAGNRGGLVYDFRDLRNYRAVLVSARTASRAGTVEVIEVANGMRRVLATSTDTQLAAGQWGEVSVVRADGVVRVAVTGMSAPYITLRQNSGTTIVGVIGSWNLVRFDDFVFNAQRGPN
jgi:PKD repeat protein